MEDNDITIEDTKLDDLNELNPFKEEDSKLTSWKNPPKTSDLKQDLEDARSIHDTHVTKVNTWLDNLNITGSAKIPEVKGRSSVVPRLIRKQAEWRYASLSEPFLSTDDVFNIDPVSYEDKEAAAQNALVLNNQFNTKLNKVKFIDEYIRTAVDEGSVVVRVGWDFEEEEIEVEVPQYAMVPIQDPLKAQEMLSQGISPIERVQVGVTIEKQLRTVKNQPTLDICNYNDVIIDPTCNGDISKASFIIYRFDTSLSELEKDGKYSNLDKINIDNNSILNEPDSALSNNSSNTSFNFKDKPRKKFTAYEYWGYWDIDGTGIVKPIVATFVGDTFIRLEENPFPDKKLPFVLAQYLPVRGSIYGEPDGELLLDNQKIIGAVTRGMIDIMGRSANGQMGIRKDALDLTNKRRFENNEDYEFNASVDPRQGFYMHTYPEIPQSAQIMLNMQNAEAESLTGVKAFSSGISGQALGNMLDINTPIPMSNGTFKTMGEIVDGDTIIASNGGFTNVVKAHAIKYPKAAFDITFSNGATIKSGIEHLWTVKVTGTNRKLREWHTVDTATLADYFNKYSDRDNCNIYIPRLHRPRTTKTNVPIDPYTLGVWLGDSNSYGARFTTEDIEILDRINQAGYASSEGNSQNSGNAINYDIMDSSGNIKDSKTGQYLPNENTLHTKLRNHNFLKRYGGEKHIPEEYFEADYYIKLDLLRGLMDTGGYAHSGAFNIFYQKESRLKDDVIRLLYSMGTIPKISKYLSVNELNLRKSKYKNNLDIKANTPIYEIGFTLSDNPFYLSRKASKYKSPKHNNTYRITNIVKTDKVLMRCLTVDSADKLYAVGKEFTLTHNTATGIRSALDATSKRELGILRRLGEGIIQIGRKIISMNALFLSEEEVIRITNEEFITIRRDDLSGNFDLKLSISTAEADNEKAQELAFMLQTMGNNMDPSMSQMILADIAKLRKMPTLAKKILDYQPQPDPMIEKQKELELALLNAQVQNEIAKGKENFIDVELKKAKVQSELAKAKLAKSNADMVDLDFLEKESGKSHERDLLKSQQKYDNDLLKERVKQLNSKSNSN